LLDPAVDGKAIDGATIDAVLAEAGLAETARRLGGLDAPHDWDDTLSTPDQHLLAVARVALARPAFAFLERPDATLDAGELERALKMLECHGVTCIMIAGGEVDPAAWPCLLEVRDDGTWHWTGPADAAA
jgi:putative ATP-binding cassette transporter